MKDSGLYPYQSIVMMMIIISCYYDILYDIYECMIKDNTEGKFLFTISSNLPVTADLTHLMLAPVS